MTAKSNPGRRNRKLEPPAKPIGFPLSVHASGKFQKKVKGSDGKWKILYFGCWAKRVGKELVPGEDGGWKQALAEYEAWKRTQDNLERERKAIEDNAERQKQQAEEQRIAKLEAQATGQLRLVELCNRFLDFNRRKVESGERSPLTYGDYANIAGFLLEVFGKHQPVSKLGPMDFSRLRSTAVKQGKSPSSLQKLITVTRSVFNFAYKSELIDRVPNYGHDFGVPSK